MPDSVELFVSYAHRDEAYREELGKHLSSLRRQNVITDWHDRKIVAGQDWSHEISAHLESAAVLLLLVSPDFMASAYCSEVEMMRALEKHARGEMVVIPVFIRPVDFEGAPFARLQGLPKDAKPVSTWQNHDEAWVDVVRGVRAAIRSLRAPVATLAPAVAKPAQTTAVRHRAGRVPVTDPTGSGKMLDLLGTEGEQLQEAFIRVFGEVYRPFGNRGRVSGLSDGNQGVQWNAGYDPRNGRRWVGVNLEGMQYQDWPVAKLIRRELRRPTLPDLVQRLDATDPVEVRWRRDYWQAASRPPIEEREIAPTPILASRLTEELWD
jgi:hypothetical protein